MNIALLAQEKARIKAGIADAVEAWAALENGAAQILTALLQTRSTYMSYAIYYAPSNTETRLAIVDNVFAQFPNLNAEIPRAKACWDKLFLKINRSKATRNKIIHGQITEVQIGKKWGCRLASAMFDYTKRNNDDALMLAGQFPGLSPHDVEQAGKIFWGRAAQCHELAIIMNFMQQEDAHPAHLSWPQKLDALEGGLNLRADQKAAPSPTKQKPPPQS